MMAWLACILLVLCVGHVIAQLESVRAIPLDQWARGAFDVGNSTTLGFSRSLEPVRLVRRQVWKDCASGDCYWNDWMSVRGGSAVDYDMQLERKLQLLSDRFGSDFIEAIELNKKEHAEDCRKSCELFYCADKDTVPTSLNSTPAPIESYSMGAVPPEDFADLFGFPLDLIKVTQTPLFSAEEATRVIHTAESEGVSQNEYRSGKYKLGGDWLDNLPETRRWFNSRLETTFFPLLAQLFPEVVSSSTVLRAHSVSLLKYNASHPRTDVHIDNGILALTVAMSPETDYEGGGTFFEHMGVDHILTMDVGHATLRPGSVRHGGHRVTSGTRYILGCFLLIEDKVEHVRRLKNQGSALRRKGDLEGAAKHFEWALGLNPKCTTCLKDWVEILQAKRQFELAETKTRQALELLENKDSDALFTLGVLLSEQGRDDESIEAYRKSIALNSEDAELCYNLGVKLGAKGLLQDEVSMYTKATEADPSFGGAWLNWGTALAESGHFDEAEAKFLRALDSTDEAVLPKALMNLSLLYHRRGEELAMVGNLHDAEVAAHKASLFADRARPLLDALANQRGTKLDVDLKRYMDQYQPQRLQCHRLVGQILAGSGNLDACEKEFRQATESFPNEIAAWQMLGRVLEVQGKAAEAAAVEKTVQTLAASVTP